MMRPNDGTQEEREDDEKGNLRFQAKIRNRSRKFHYGNQIRSKLHRYNHLKQPSLPCLA